MFTYRIAVLSVERRKFLLRLLAFFGFCGVYLAVAVAYNADIYFSCLMRLAVFSRVSIVNLLSSILLPFLFTFVFTSVSNPSLFVFLSFFKSFSFALSVSLIHYTFAPAGWIVSCVILLPDSVAVLLLYIFWIRHIKGSQSKPAGELLLFSVISALLAVADALWMSRYISEIFNA